jgi:hypothetical protein
VENTPMAGAAKQLNLNHQGVLTLGTHMDGVLIA